MEQGSAANSSYLMYVTSRWKDFGAKDALCSLVIVVADLTRV